VIVPRLPAVARHRQGGPERPPRRPPHGWRVDIKSETQLAEEEAGYGGEEWAEGEWREDADSARWCGTPRGRPALSADEWNAGGGDETTTPTRDDAAVVAEASGGEDREPSEGGDGSAPDDGADRASEPEGPPVDLPGADEREPAEGGDGAAPDEGAERASGAS
jgi:hypothetical protein